MSGALRVVATAGHVDHGKSSLIQRLTGMDPDRLAEEKRRGLTIDLGYAWCTLPSGREVGFVDVPGHERFITNMLAGVGPVPLVLFVVAADEGWKPQSEEHLQILDVLGVAAGVVALTKIDLVDAEARPRGAAGVGERLDGTPLAAAPIVEVSARTGEGVDGLASALDSMLASAPEPAEARARLFVDRSFTIRGAGTVVTGTLEGGRLALGDEVELLPGGRRSRIRSLQTHRREEQHADPVSRVAANLAGVERGEAARGDVLAHTGEWRATSTFEGTLRPVRGLREPIGERGAFTVHAGAAETPARLRVLGDGPAEPGAEAFVRLRLSRPLALGVGDRYVLRDAGRRITVGGGTVLDTAPPRRAGADAELRLAARRVATRERLPGLLTTERGAVFASEAASLTGSSASGGMSLGHWYVRPDVHDAVRRTVEEALATFHAAHPLEPGAEAMLVQRAAEDALGTTGAPRDPSLVDALLEDLEDRGRIARSAGTIALATHRVDLGGERAGDVERLVGAVSGEHERTPPTVKELAAAGFPRELVDAAARSGAIVRISPDLVVSPALVDRATALVRDHANGGITVSAVREALGTSRKYAVPLLEHLDREGVTKRVGDLRFPRELPRGES